MTSKYVMGLHNSKISTKSERYTAHLHISNEISFWSIIFGNSQFQNLKKIRVLHFTPSYYIVDKILILISYLFLAQSPPGLALVYRELRLAYSERPQHCCRFRVKGLLWRIREGSRVYRGVLDLHGGRDVSGLRGEKVCGRVESRSRV